MREGANFARTIERCDGRTVSSLVQLSRSPRITPLRNSSFLRPLVLATRGQSGKRVSARLTVRSALKPGVVTETISVRPNQWVSDIAAQRNCDVEDIQILNPDVDLDVVYVGQELTVPKRPSPFDQVERELNRALSQFGSAFGARKAMKFEAEKGDAVIDLSETEEYALRRNEWVGKIARELGIDIEVIQKVNPGVDLDNVQPEQKILVPRRTLRRDPERDKGRETQRDTAKVGSRDSQDGLARESEGRENTGEPEKRGEEGEKKALTAKETSFSVAPSTSTPPPTPSARPPSPALSPSLISSPALQQPALPTDSQDELLRVERERNRERGGGRMERGGDDVSRETRGDSGFWARRVRQSLASSLRGKRRARGEGDRAVEGADDSEAARNYGGGERSGTSALEIYKPSSFPPTISYIFRRGDWLSSIAAEYGISVTELQKLNPQLNFREVRSGDVLQVPLHVRQSRKYILAWKEDEGETKRAEGGEEGVREEQKREYERVLQSRRNRSSPSAPSSPALAPNGVSWYQYMVQPGDSLLSIAEGFGIGFKEIVLANQITNDDEGFIKVGQILRIPIPQSSPQQLQRRGSRASSGLNGRSSPTYNRYQQQDTPNSFFQLGVDTWRSLISSMASGLVASPEPKSGSGRPSSEKIGSGLVGSVQVDSNRFGPGTSKATFGGLVVCIVICAVFACIVGLALAKSFSLDGTAKALTSCRKILSVLAEKAKTTTSSLLRLPTLEFGSGFSPRLHPLTASPLQLGNVSTAPQNGNVYENVYVTNEYISKNGKDTNEEISSSGKYLPSALEMERVLLLANLSRSPDTNSSSILFPPFSPPPPSPPVCSLTAFHAYGQSNSGFSEALRLCSNHLRRDFEERRRREMGGRESFEDLEREFLSQRPSLALLSVGKSEGKKSGNGPLSPFLSLLSSLFGSQLSNSSSLAVSSVALPFSSSPSLLLSSLPSSLPFARVLGVSEGREEACERAGREGFSLALLLLSAGSGMMVAVNALAGEGELEGTGEEVRNGEGEERAVSDTLFERKYGTSLERALNSIRSSVEEGKTPTLNSIVAIVPNQHSTECLEKISSLLPEVSAYVVSARPETSGAGPWKTPNILGGKQQTVENTGDAKEAGFSSPLSPTLSPGISLVGVTVKADFSGAFLSSVIGRWLYGEQSLVRAKAPKANARLGANTLEL